jgi:hypothetical protein
MDGGLLPELTLLGPTPTPAEGERSLMPETSSEGEPT